MKIYYKVHTDGMENIDEYLKGPASTAEKWVANAILKDTRPYVPALTGSFMNRAHTDGRFVIYPGPYARYLYYGKVMEGPKYGPKHATDKDLVFTKTVNPQAQAHWFEASKAQNKDKWLKGAKKIVRRELGRK